MANTFACRLAFEISHPVETGKGVIRLTFRHRPFSLQPPYGGPLKGAHQLVAIARDFPTEGDARSYGAALKDGLLALAIEARLGVDVGKDRPRGGPGKVLVDLALADCGLVLIPDIHGVSVYPDDGRHQVVGGSATAHRAVGEDRFVELLANADRFSQPLPHKIRIAAELLSASYIGESSYATLILSVAAVEAATSTSKRSPAYINLLKRAIEGVGEDTVNRNEKNALIHDLKRLACESISKSCFSLICNKLDHETAVEFQVIYSKARSAFVHGRVSFDRWEVWDPALRAQMIASRLLAVLIAERH
jgi:hypothetical protein